MIGTTPARNNTRYLSRNAAFVLLQFAPREREEVRERRERREEAQEEVEEEEEEEEEEGEDIRYKAGGISGERP